MTLRELIKWLEDNATPESNIPGAFFHENHGRFNSDWDVTDVVALREYIAAQ